MASKLTGRSLEAFQEHSFVQLGQHRFAHPQSAPPPPPPTPLLLPRRTSRCGLHPLLLRSSPLPERRPQSGELGEVLFHEALLASPLNVHRRGGRRPRELRRQVSCHGEDLAGPEVAQSSSLSSPLETLAMAVDRREGTTSCTCPLLGETGSAAFPPNPSFQDSTVLHYGSHVNRRARDCRGSGWEHDFSPRVELCAVSPDTEKRGDTGLQGRP